MLQLHSASDEAISYLQKFVQKRHKRYDSKKTNNTHNILLEKIQKLEKKISNYETHQEHILDNILKNLDT